jgi:hypothetical protein
MTTAILLFEWTTVGKCMSISMVSQSDPRKLDGTISYLSNNGIYIILVPLTHLALKKNMSNV